jgi:hypothetical protein
MNDCLAADELLGESKRRTKAVGIKKNMFQATNLTRDMTSIHINIELSFERKLGIGINSGFLFHPDNGKRKRKGV